jgi:transcriptional regulator with XRE-family HTH domain
MAATLRDPVILCQRHPVTVFRFNAAMTPGERIRRRREHLEWKVPVVAKKAGMASSTLYEIENGRMRSSTRMHQLCKVLGLRVEYVETGELPELIADEPRGKYRVADPAPAYTFHGMQATPEEVEIGVEWGKLDEPMRGAIKEQIYLLVANQVRRKRRKDPPGDRDPPQPRKHS